MKEIPILLLVPGDIVHLSAGDMVPADLRLRSAKDLFVNQASLTGESLPVEKVTGIASDAIKDPLQLPNLCFMGTDVVSGTAIGVVALTGRSAYFVNLASDGWPHLDDQLSALVYALIHSREALSPGMLGGPAASISSRGCLLAWPARREPNGRQRETTVAIPPKMAKY